MRKIFACFFAIPFWIALLGASPEALASIFFPEDVLQDAQKVETGRQNQFCSNEDTEFLSEAGNLPKKVQGFTSRMKGGGSVEGADEVTEFIDQFAALSTLSAIKNDDLLKEKLLSSLYKAAVNGTLTETPLCVKDGKIICEKDWKKQDGSDLSPLRDGYFSYNRALVVSFSYFNFLYKFRPDDERHQTIQKWLLHFLTATRNYKPALGQAGGWSVPNLMLQLAEDGTVDCKSSKRCGKQMIKNLVTEMSSFIANDGSIYPSTFRGDRALWYHASDLNNIFVILEIARKLEIEIPSDLEARLFNAVDLFLRGFDDHQFMDKWANEGINGRVRSGQQDIESDLKHLPVGSWQHIFIYRYPNTELAKTLIERHSVPFGRSSKSDLTWGIGIGCIYNTASLGRNFISEKASNGQSKTPKLNSKTNGSEAIVKSKSGTTDTNISLATSLVGEYFPIKINHELYVDNGFKAFHFFGDLDPIRGTLLVNYFDDGTVENVRVSIDESSLIPKISPNPELCPDVNKNNFKTLFRKRQDITEYKIYLYTTDKYSFTVEDINACLFRHFSPEVKQRLEYLARIVPLAGLKYGTPEIQNLIEQLAALPDAPKNVSNRKAKRKQADLLKVTSTSARILDDTEEFLSFLIDLVKQSENASGPNVKSIKVMIDFAGDAQKKKGNASQLRIEMESAAFLDPANANKVLSCAKSTIKKKGSTLTAYRLYSGNYEEKNECVLSTMTEAGRKEAESLLATLSQIFANDNVKKSDPYGVLEKHSKLLIGAQ